MPSLIEFLTKTNTLYFLRISAAIIVISIILVAIKWNVDLLDMKFSSVSIVDTLKTFDETQKIAHLWISSTLDLALPIAYGLLFIGYTMKYYPGQYILVVPGILVIPVDLLENIMHIQILSNSLSDSTIPYSLLETKVIFTFLKFILFGICLFVFFRGWYKCRIANT